ncbi:MAG: glycosyltransferase family 4 protein [Candidatus Kryptoniota bacterium]
MKSVLVVHPQYRVLGGAELVSAKIIEWLLSRPDLTVTVLSLDSHAKEGVLTLGLGDKPGSRLAFKEAYSPNFVKFAKSSIELLKLAFLHRSARSFCKQYDICVSTYNEIDFGKKGFQYIHHPSFANRSVLKAYHFIGKESVIDRFDILKKTYDVIVTRVSGDTVEGFRRNVTATNSRFISEIIKSVYNIESTVIYPGFVADNVKLEFPQWESREFRFVSVGRIAPDKDLMRVLDLFGTIASSFPDAAFSIIGRVSDAQIKNIVEREVHRRRLNIRIIYNADDRALLKELESSKFYLHGRIFEHFGISVLEALQSGCLPFVHDSGGVKEIVTNDVLRYQDGNDLVRKILYLLENDDERKKVSIQLQESITRFKKSNFFLSLDKIFHDNGLLD